MVSIRFTYYHTGNLPDGRHIVHLHVKQLEPTWTDSPNKERKAILDAAQVVKDIIANNVEKHVNKEERLLQEGDPPENAVPIFMFALGVSWNQRQKIPHYSKICYKRYGWDAKWQPVAELGMEQYEYTYSVVHSREKFDLEQLAKKD